MPDRLLNCRCIIVDPRTTMIGSLPLIIISGLVSTREIIMRIRIIRSMGIILSSSSSSSSNSNSSSSTTTTPTTTTTTTSILRDCILAGNMIRRLLGIVYSHSNNSVIVSRVRPPCNWWNHY
eukprot:4207076-Pyramimonas_sp.AAC.1